MEGARGRRVTLPSVAPAGSTAGNGGAAQLVRERWVADHVQRGELDRAGPREVARIARPELGESGTSAPITRPWSGASRSRETAIAAQRSPAASASAFRCGSVKWMVSLPRTR